MLLEEAKWIGEQLLKLADKTSTILNIGSSSLHSRSVLQPHMDEYIFKPLNKKGVKVIHTDIQDAEGVDMIGDLTDKDFLAELKKLNINIILCSNLLEHITEKEIITEAIAQIISNNGYALITVPLQYPYHLDPIDTIYRPEVNDLMKHFKQFELIEGIHLTASRINKNGAKQKNYFQMLTESPKLFLKLVFRSLLPFYKYKMWKITINDLIKMFKPFKVTCILIKKTK